MPPLFFTIVFSGDTRPRPYELSILQSLLYCILRRSSRLPPVTQESVQPITYQVYGILSCFQHHILSPPFCTHTTAFSLQSTTALQGCSVRLCSLHRCFYPTLQSCNRYATSAPCSRPVTQQQPPSNVFCRMFLTIPTRLRSLRAWL